MNVLPCEIDDGVPLFAGRKVALESRIEKTAAGAKLEIGVRPEFVSFASEGIPVEIVKVADAGRYRIVDTRHGEAHIKLLVAEGEALPSEGACIGFDPAHTQVYADGWIIA